MRVVIFGSGYVGLVTAACFAEAGHFVTSVDVDAARVRRLQQGDCPISEPHLGVLLTRQRRRGR